MKRKYTVYANCQGHALAMVLNSSSAFREQYEYIVTKPIQSMNQDDLNILIEKTAPSVDLFIYQPISDKYKNNPKYGYQNVIKKLKKKSEKISFPSCYFKGYHPELVILKDANQTNIPIKFKVGNQELEPILIHDLNIIKSFLLGYDTKIIQDQITGQNHYNQSFLSDNLSETLIQLQSRESNTGINIAISQFIKEHFRNENLFHTFNHPTSITFKYIAIKILQKLRIDSDFGSVPDAIGLHSFPIYKSVYNKLKIKFNNCFEYKIQGHYLQMEDVICQYLDFYKNIPKNILENSLKNWNLSNNNKELIMSTSKFKENLENGDKLRQKPNIAELIAAHQKAIASKPDYIQPLIQLGEIYETQENWLEAAKYYRRMTGLSPDNHGGYLRLGRVLAKQNKVYGAIAAYAEAIELKPDLPAGIYRTYGDLLLQVNDNNPDAIAAYQKAAEIKSDWGAGFYNKFANLLEKQDRLDEATTYYLKALCLQADNPTQYQRVGNIYFKRGLLKEAAGNYQKALEFNPEFVNAYKRLGDLLKQKHQLDDAVKCYQKALEIKPDFKNCYRALGNVFMEQGKQSEAQQCFQMAS